LERYGKGPLANEIALEHLRIASDVFQSTGTVWENYAPDASQPGKPAKGDFVGWSGIGPILYLLEYAIGLKADARENALTWRLGSTARQGCERFRFNGRVVSLVAEPVAPEGKRFQVTVQSDGAFKLRLVRGDRTRSVSVKAGEQVIPMP
jgi:hypothetical protein